VGVFAVIKGRSGAQRLRRDYIQAGVACVKIRDSVFDSVSERKLHKALKTRWGKMFNLFPQLPFTKIVDIEGGGFTEKERQFLFKTNVDYTLCDRQGNKPLISIEFDGLGHGFSRMGEYIQFMPAEDPYRKLKLDLKLRIALRLLYPYFVVSYGEAYPFDFEPEWDLTVLDGIIGQALAYKHLLKALTAIDEQELEKYTPQDIVDMREMEAELTWDPIASEAAKLKGELVRKGIVKVWSHGALDDPDSLLPFDYEYAKRFGYWYNVQGDFGEVKRTVWVRNVAGVGVDPLTIVRNIAELLTVREVWKKLLK